MIKATRRPPAVYGSIDRCGYYSHLDTPALPARLRALRAPHIPCPALATRDAGVSDLGRQCRPLTVRLRQQPMHHEECCPRAYRGFRRQCLSVSWNASGHVCSSLSRTLLRHLCQGSIQRASLYLAAARRSGLVGGVSLRRTCIGGCIALPLSRRTGTVRVSR